MPDPGPVGGVELDLENCLVPGTKMVVPNHVSLISVKYLGTS